MITIHHLGVSQSERIVWQCEELQIPYELKRYQRDPQTRLAPPEYRALHPAGTSPVISDGDLVLAETGAIMEYINTRYGKGELVVAPHEARYADYLFWFHYANGSHQPHLMGQMIANIAGYAGDNPVLNTVLGRVDRGLDMMEAQLAKLPYLVGEKFTSADIMMFFQLTTMNHFVEQDLSTRPHLSAYVQRVSQRPAYRAAMSKCDPELLSDMP